MCARRENYARRLGERGSNQKKIAKKKKDIEALIQASNALQKGLEAQMSRIARAMGNAKQIYVERPGPAGWGDGGADAAGAGSSKIN